MPPVSPRSNFLSVNAMAWHPLCILRERTGRPAMGISTWSPGERPRERLLANGASTLTDAELVAILLRTGVRGKSAVDLAREMIERFKGLNGLIAGGADLKTVKGLGPA